MPNVEKCAKCGSSAIAHRVMVVDHDQTIEENLNLRVDARPRALFLKKSALSILHAEACSACGYTEFYADDPGALFEAFSQIQDSD